MSLVMPLFVASIASLTLMMTSMSSTINLLQQMGILLVRFPAPLVPQHSELGNLTRTSMHPWAPNTISLSFAPQMHQKQSISREVFSRFHVDTGYKYGPYMAYMAHTLLLSE